MTTVYKYLPITAVASLLTGLFLFLVNNIWTTPSKVFLASGALILIILALVKRDSVFRFFRKRSTKYGFNAIVLSLIVLGILALANYTLNRHSWRFDTTASGQYSIAAQTVKILEALEEEVKVTAFQTQIESGRLDDLLKEYSYYSDNFRYEVVDPDKNPDLAKSLGVKKYGELFLQSRGRTERIEDVTEEKITNALIKISSRKEHNIYFLSGHGENSFELSAGERESYSLVAAELRKVNYRLSQLELFQTDSVPEDASLVVLAGPSKNLLQREINALNVFLSGGGSLLLLVEARVNDPGLEEFILGLGVKLQNDIILEQSASFIISGGGLKRDTRISIEPTAAAYGVHRITEDFRLASVYPTVRSLLVRTENDSGDYDITELIFSSKSSWGETDLALLDKSQTSFDKNRDHPGPLVIGVVGKIKEGKSGGRFIIVGDSEFASNPYIERAPGNKDLFLNMVSWLLEDESLISIRPRDPEDRRVNMTLKESQIVFWLLIVTLPIAILGFGITIYFRRRR